MRTFDGSDIKCLLEKQGHTLSGVARSLGVTPQCVSLVIWGQTTSERVVSYIEGLLGFEPGQIKIVRASNRRAA